MNFYTTLHGGPLEAAARQVLQADREAGRAIFASFSAAQWLAPYGRTGMQYFYADDAGLEHLLAGLKLSSTSKGENVTVTVLKDLGVFRDTGGASTWRHLHQPSPDVSRSCCGRGARAGSSRPSTKRKADMAEMTQGEPQSAADYDDRTTAAVKTVLVEIGQILGSFKGKFAIVGGAVPWLLLDNQDMPHVGTLDVDLGLDAGALGDGEYAMLIEALQGHGYEQRRELRRFQPVRQVPTQDGGTPIDVIVDFLMPRDAEIVKNVPPLIGDFAVQRADGADLALHFYQYRRWFWADMCTSLRRRNGCPRMIAVRSSGSRKLSVRSTPGCAHLGAGPGRS
jgi:hypothetical protein